MTPSKRSPRRRSAPAPALAERLDHMQILLENIESQNRAVLEAVFLSREENGRAVDELRAELSRRVDVVADVLRDQGRRMDGVEHQLVRVEHRLDRMDEDLRGIRTDLARSVDAAAFAALEQRVATLEQCVGLA